MLQTPFVGCLARLRRGSIAEVEARLEVIGSDRQLCAQRAAR